MARSIVMSEDPKIGVTAQLLEVLNRAISLRKRVARKHGLGHGRQRNDLLASLAHASNKRHSHFIRVLEEVREILHERIETPSVDSGIKPDAQFDSCQEQSETGVDSGDAQPDTAVEDDPQIHFQNITTTIQYDEELIGDDLEDETVRRSPNYCEIALAIDCLLEDLQNLRSVIQEIWKSFLEGKCDLVTASLLSQAAIGLARGMEEDIDNEDVAALRGVIGVYDCLLMYHAERLKEENGALSWDDQDETSLFEALDPYLYHAYVLMRDLALNSPMPSDEVLRTPDCVNLCERFREARIILGRFLPELRTFKEQQGFDDEYIRAMLFVIQDGNIGLWTVFATQIYLDLYRILGQKVDSCYNILRNYCDTAANAIRNYTNAEAQIHGEPQNLKESPTHKQLILILDEIEERVLKEQQFVLLKKHPIRCGLLANLFQEKLRKASVDAVNSQNHVLATIHLYNSLRQEKLLNRPWKDMEFLLAIQSPPNLFLGVTPKSTLDYSRKFDIAVLGASVVKYAKDKGRFTEKGTNKNLSERGYRKLEVLAPVHSMLFQSLREKDLLPTLTSSDLRNFANASEWSMDEVKGVDGKTAVAQKRLLAWQLTKRKQDMRRPVTLQDLFRDLRMALSAENLETTFDYLKLSEFCQNILLNVQCATIEHLVSKPETKFSLEELVTHLVRLILISSTTSIGAKKKKYNRCGGKAKGKGKHQHNGPNKDQERDTTMLKGAAASGFHKHFEKFGDVEIFNRDMAHAMVEAELTEDGTLIKRPLGSTESIKDPSAVIPGGNTRVPERQPNEPQHDEPQHNQPESVEPNELDAVELNRPDTVPPNELETVHPNQPEFVQPNQPEAVEPSQPEVVIGRVGKRHNVFFSLY